MFEIYTLEDAFQKAKLTHDANNWWKCNNVFSANFNQKKKAIVKYCTTMTMNIKRMVNLKRTTRTMGMLGVPCMALIRESSNEMRTRSDV
jgi:hypothetical protein